ncbi:MAG: Bcr/CflA family efflux MFS transporter [Simkania sp.]|nr:Bcr/CflA family efflux MFS transporter [Simkania sp.]
MLKITTSNKSVLSAFVFLSVALGNAGGTLYLPALLQIGSDLHATNSLMKLTLSVYLASIGLSQLFYGPLSDAFGRRINLLVGVFIFFIGSLIVMFANSPEILLIGRIVQGGGIGTANAVGYALLRDIYSGPKLILQLSYLSLFVGITPIIAPLFGGYLVTYVGWRACFALLALIALALVVAKYRCLPETNQTRNLTAHHPHVILKNYWVLLRNFAFLGYILAAALGFAGLLTANTMLPFLLIDILKIPPAVYGWLTVCTGTGFVLGALISGRVAIRLNLLRTIVLGIVIELIACIGGIAMEFQGTSVVAVIMPLTVVLFGIGWIIPTASSGAMGLFPNMAGSAAALLGAALFLMASLFTAIGAHINERTAFPLFVSVVGICLINLLSAQLIRIKNSS